MHSRTHSDRLAHSDSQQHMPQPGDYFEKYTPPELTATAGPTATASTTCPLTRGLFLKNTPLQSPQRQSEPIATAQQHMPQQGGYFETHTPSEPTAAAKPTATAQQHMPQPGGYFDNNANHEPTETAKPTATA